MSENKTLVDSVVQSDLGNVTLIDGVDTYAQAQELYSSWAILILILLLMITLITSYLLQRWKVKFIHETVVAIFLGMFVGFIIKMLDDPVMSKMVSFKYTYFFNLLLPPIILNSGYELERENFFKNIKYILTYAFLGTIISTIIIGMLTYLITLSGIGGFKMGFIECLMFSSILSSTDPVTVISIFSQLQVDPKLNAIIIGESMLNDSVAIVLFESLQHVVDKELEISLLWEGVGDFVGVFIGSLLIGLSLGLICALTLKFTKLHAFHSIESCLITLVAYASYFLSNACQMSGIVSLLFCSIILKHYAFKNLSLRSQKTTQSMFQILAQLSENFCFIYLGITLFTSQKEQYNVILILCTLITVCIARYCSIIPISNLINWITKRATGSNLEVIGRPYQIMLFWAGLRGAVAFALAMEVESPNSALMRGTILIVVVVTVILFGGTTPVVMKHLGIKTGQDAQYSPLYSESPTHFDGSFSDETYDNEPNSYRDYPLGYDKHRPSLDNPGEEHLSVEPNFTSGVAPIEPRRSTDRHSEDWFQSLDEHYLQPLFTHQRAPEHSPSTPTVLSLQADEVNPAHSPSELPASLLKNNFL